jgi:hypothetical protein
MDRSKLAKHSATVAGGTVTFEDDGMGAASRKKCGWCRHGDQMVTGLDFECQQNGMALRQVSSV